MHSIYPGITKGWALKKSPPFVLEKAKRKTNGKNAADGKD